MGWRYGGYKEDSFIQAWLAKHPKSYVQPLVVMTPSERNQPQMITCRITDHRDTLNADLVRNGCLSAGQMIWEVDDPLFKPGHHGDLNCNVTILWSNADYKAYYQQMVRASEHAQNNKLGIWADSPKH
jgi:endonuclease YncB( thermonuclease family)